MNHASEQWTEESQSNDEDVTAAYAARKASDELEEEADDSEPVVPVTLRRVYVKPEERSRRSRLLCRRMSACARIFRRSSQW